MLRVRDPINAFIWQLTLYVIVLALWFSLGHAEFQYYAVPLNMDCIPKRISCHPKCYQNLHRSSVYLETAQLLLNMSKLLLTVIHRHDRRAPCRSTAEEGMA